MTTWRRWLEFIFGPILFSGEAVFLWFLLTLGLGGQGYSKSLYTVWANVLWLAGSVLILGMVVSLWKLVIWGSERVSRNPFSRWFTIVTVSVMVLVNGLYIVWTLVEFMQGLVTKEWSVFTGILGMLVFGLFLGAPMWVGLRYLAPLLFGNRA